jgi:alkanesulfonate monooxygenase SsuD/methylene tetrahydromethanopterin reductase-like flavin-dependent oxidoreductase (luciferase family)
MRIEVILGSGLTAAQVEELGVLAEQVGLAAVWVQSFPGRRDPLLTIAGLARLTRRIRLGVLPTSPWEVHPLRIADGLLTLNELCGGRAALLVGGLGHSVMRVTGLAPRQRVAAVRDTVRILKGISPDQPLNYEGQVFSLMHYQPDWAVQPPPFVSVGATGPQMLTMAAGCADGVMMSDVPLARMGEVMDHIRQGLAAAGRGPGEFRVNNFMAWHIGRDREAALAEARRELVWRGLLQKWHTAGFLGDEDADFVESRRDRFLQAFLTGSATIEGVPGALVDRLIANLTFAGGPDDIPRVAEELRRYAAAGQDQVALKVHDNPAEAIRLIGERLRPLLEAG